MLSLICGSAETQIKASVKEVLLKNGYLYQNFRVFIREISTSPFSERFSVTWEKSMNHSSYFSHVEHHSSRTSCILGDLLSYNRVEKFGKFLDLFPGTSFVYF